MSNIRDREAKLQYNRLYMSRLVQQRRENGLCVNCGKLANPGKTQCQPCLDSDTRRKTQQRIQYKQRAVEYLGGQCLDCGLKTDIAAVYDFHHREPEEKHATINHLLAIHASWSKLQKELDKCDLLCANCHRIRHAKEEELP